MAKHVVAIEGTYEGDLRCRARHGPSGGEVLTDAPADNQGLGAAFSPTDLVATALGTCLLTILGIQARARSLDLAGMRFATTKEMVADPHRRIARLATTVYLPARLLPAQRKLLEEAAHACPVRRSLHPAVDLPLEFRYE